MPNHSVISHPAGLELQALWYASGEMAPAEAEAFEAQLADDQDARDALAHAAGLLAPFSGKVEPDPAYREEVRRRLRQSKRRLVPQDSAAKDRSRPWTWTVMAAAAAAVLLFMIVYPFTPAPAQPETPNAGAAPGEGVAATAGQPAAESKEAVDFADLSNVERVTKVREEASARKRKVDERKPTYPIQDVLGPMVPRKAM